METSLTIRICAIFSIFLISSLGILCPFLVDTDSDFFRILKTGSAGVMLGLAMVRIVLITNEFIMSFIILFLQIHILPESYGILSEEVPVFDPLAYCLTCFGVILVVVIDQIISICIQRKVKPLKRKLEENSNCNNHFHEHGEKCGSDDAIIRENSNDNNHFHEHGERCGFVTFEGNDDTPNQISLTPHTPTIDQSKPNPDSKMTPYGKENFSALSNVLESDNTKDLLIAYLLEVSIAIHSIIIGVDIGMIESKVSLIVLVIVLGFHQFLEGVGLGSMILTNKSAFNNYKIAMFVVIFAGTMPVGILIGILTASENVSRSSMIARGVADSLAAGSLLFISLSEMVAPSFSDAYLIGKHKLRLSMTVSFALGTLSMGIIAIWA